MAFEKTKDVEDLFKELDAREFHHIAKPLADFRIELMNKGFTRREAVRLVENYSQFVYSISLEDFISDKRKEEMFFEDSFDTSLEGETEGDFEDDGPEMYG